MRDVRRKHPRAVGLVGLGIGLAGGLLALWLTHPGPTVAAPAPAAVGTYQMAPAGNMVWRLNTATGRLEICGADPGWVSLAKDVRPAAPMAGSCVAMPPPTD